MRTSNKQFLLFSLSSVSVVGAFMNPCPSDLRPRASMLPSTPDSNGDLKVSTDNLIDTTPPDTTSSTVSWADQLDSGMLEEVRLELVQKYLAQGITQQEAEKEVDIFLADKDRSEKYLEMRMYAAAQADDLGLGLGLQLLGGFLFGFIGIAGPKYFHAYQAAHTVGDLPNPLL